MQRELSSTCSSVSAIREFIASFPAKSRSQQEPSDINNAHNTFWTMILENTVDPEVGQAGRQRAWLLSPVNASCVRLFLCF